MSRKLKAIVLFSVIASLFAVLGSSGLAYTPRPGVLSPDQVDFGGKTVNILVGDLNWVVYNGGKPLEERIAEAEALFNCKIEVGATGGANAMIARILAGDSTYDILRFEHRGVTSTGDPGYAVSRQRHSAARYFESCRQPTVIPLKSCNSAASCTVWCDL